MNLKITSLFIFLTALVSNLALAQAPDTPYPCAASEMQRNLFEKMPLQLRLQEQIEEQIHQHQLRHSNKPELRSSMPIVLPVVVHIIHQNGPENISDTRVQQAIQNLNDAFAQRGHYAKLGKGTSIPVQFCLAQRTPDNKTTNGISRTQSPLTTMTMETQDQALKNLVRWDPRQYINIWVVTDINSQSQGPGVAGYAYYASAHGSNFDGIVCESRFFGSSPSNDAVLIHEMGHYFNLYHTFEGGCANDRCDLEGDRVCDTPPDQAKGTGCVYNSCDTDAKDSRSINPLKTDVNDLTENFMDYSPFTCQYTFTQGQADRMTAALQTVRKSLLESPGCLPPCNTVISAGFSVPTELVPGKPYTFNFTGSGAVRYEWRVNGQPTSFLQNMTLTFTDAGTYNIDLKVTGASESCFASTRQQIKVVCNVTAAFNNKTQEINEGETLQFTSTSTGATRLKWTIDGLEVGTSNQLNYSFNQTKEYFVVLEATNGICSASSSALIKVKSPCGDSLAQFYYENDQLFSFMNYELPDKGMICVGNASGSNDCLVMRLNPDGTIKWSKIVPDIPGGTNRGFCLLEDGNYAVLLSRGIASNSTLVKMTPDGNVLWRKQYPNSLSGLQVFTASGGKMIFYSSNRLIMVDQNGDQVWEKRLLGNNQFYGLTKRKDNSFFVAVTGQRFLIIDENGQVKIEKKLNYSFDGGRGYPVCLPDDGIAMVFTDQNSTYLVRMDANLEVKWAKKTDGNDFNASVGVNKTGEMLFAFNRRRTPTFSAFTSDGSLLWTITCAPGIFAETQYPPAAYGAGWAAPLLALGRTYIVRLPNLDAPRGCFIQPDTLTFSGFSVNTIAETIPNESVSPEPVLTPNFPFPVQEIRAVADCRLPVKCPESCGDTIVQNYYEAEDEYLMTSYPLLNGGRIFLGRVAFPSKVLITKVDKNGKILWIRRFDPTTNGTEKFAELSDGSYMLAFAQARDVILVKLNQDGQVIWSKLISSNMGSMQGLVRDQNDGIYLQTYSELSRLDRNGNIIWTKSLSGRYLFTGMLIRSDGQLICSMNDEFSTTRIYALLDANGNSLKQTQVVSKWFSTREKLALLPDGGFVVPLVRPDVPSNYLLRFDPNVNLSWSKSIDYTNFYTLATNSKGLILYGRDLGGSKVGLYVFDASGTFRWAKNLNIEDSANLVHGNSLGDDWTIDMFAVKGTYHVVVPNYENIQGCYFTPLENSFKVSNIVANPASVQFIDKAINSSDFLNLVQREELLTRTIRCKTIRPCSETCTGEIVQNHYESRTRFEATPFPLSNGGRILLGVMDNTSGILISKLAMDGTVLWTKNIRSSGPSSKRVLELADGNLMLSFAQANSIVLLKMNHDGQFIWAKSILSATPGVNGLFKDQSGGFMILGVNEIFRVDANGKVIVAKKMSSNYGFVRMIQLYNGQYIFSYSDSSTQQRVFGMMDSNCNFSKQVQVKTDLGGGLLAEHPDGGFLVQISKSNPFTNLLLRFDTEMNLQWSKSAPEEHVFLSVNSEGEIISVIRQQDRFTSTIFEPNGNFLWAANANGRLNSNSGIGTSYGEGWIIHLGTENGFNHVIIPNAIFSKSCFFTQTENVFRTESIQATAGPAISLPNQTITSSDLSGVEILEDEIIRTIRCKSTRPCPEICDNNLDDNNDGLIDCKDPSCKCNDCADLSDGLISAIDSVKCQGDSLRVYLKICNKGGRALAASTPIAFYDGNPTRVNPTPLAAVQRLGISIKADTCIQRVFKIKAPGRDSIFAVLSDDYRRRRPYSLNDPVGSNDLALECDFRNNLLPFRYQAPGVPKLDLGPDQLVCENSVTKLKATPGFNRYRWPDGSTDTTFTASSPGIYWLDAWDVCGNKQSDTIRLNLQPLGKVDLGPNRTICEGDSVVLNVNGFEKVTWWPNEKLSCVDCKTTSIKPDVSRLYLVTARTGNCFAGDSIYLKVEKRPQINLDRDRDTCDASSIQLATLNEPNVTYTWNTGTTGPNLRVNTSGQYSLKAEREGCQNQDSVQVRFSERPKFSLGRDTSFCEGQKLILAPNPARSGQYTWSNGANTSSLEVQKAGIYSLRIRQNNCEWTDTLVLKLEDCLAFAVYVPNVFSPNSLVNGEFKPFFSTQTQVLDYQFAIYDRWGGIVFSTKNPEQGWKGENKGVQCGQGVYVWRLNVRYQTAKKEAQTKQQVGEVLLLR